MFVLINDLVVVSKPRMIVGPSTSSKSQLETNIHCISTLSFIFMSANIARQTDVGRLSEHTKMDKFTVLENGPVLDPFSAIFKAITEISRSHFGS